MSTSKSKTSISFYEPDILYVYIYDDWKQTIPRYMDAIAEVRQVIASICVSTACVDGLYDVLNVPTVKRVTITLEKDWDAKTLCQHLNLALRLHDITFVEFLDMHDLFRDIPSSVTDIFELHEYLLQLGALP